MPNITGFDITQAAQAYSAVAGIIAGFAFAVLVWLIDRLDRPGMEESDNVLITHALAFLAISFVANVLVAFLWALISGETDLNSSRPAILSFLAGLNFAFVAPITMEAMTFLVATANAKRIVGLFRRIFFASALISLAFQWTSTIGLLRTQGGSSGALAQNSLLLTVIAPLTVMILIGAALISRRATGQRFGLDTEQSYSMFVWLWLAAMFLSALGFGYVSTSSGNWAMPLWIVAASNLVWSGLMGWAITFLPIEEG